MRFEHRGPSAPSPFEGVELLLTLLLNLGTGGAPAEMLDRVRALISEARPAHRRKRAATTTVHSDHAATQPAIPPTSQPEAEPAKQPGTAPARTEASMALVKPAAHEVGNGATGAEQLANAARV